MTSSYYAYRDYNLMDKLLVTLILIGYEIVMVKTRSITSIYTNTQIIYVCMFVQSFPTRMRQHLCFQTTTSRGHLEDQDQKLLLISQRYELVLFSIFISPVLNVFQDLLSGRGHFK